MTDKIKINLSQLLGTTSEYIKTSECYVSGSQAAQGGRDVSEDDPLFMSIKDIITVPDATLKKKSEPVEKIGTNEKKLINDLFETMYNSKGIGLAAVQVGILKRILVIDVSNKDKKKEPLSFINPSIKKVSNETSIYEEGCLSIPDTFIEIERPKICEVEYIDIQGKKKFLQCDGLLSTCLQHEINHLDGKLIIDHLSKLKRDLIIKKISKSTKNPDRIIV